MRKLESMQRMEADELEAKLREQRSINIQLQAKLDELKLKTTAVPLPSEKAALLMERLERSVEAIERQGDAESESLRRLQEKKRERHYKRMSEWDKQFEDSRKALDFLLEEASVLISKVKDKEKPEPIEQLERELEQAMQVIPERRAEDLEADLVERVEKDEADVLEAAGSAKVLQFKLRSLLNETAATVEEAVADKASMTADGMSVEPSDAKLEPVKHPQKKSTRKAASSFWGDLEPYLEENELQRNDEGSAMNPAATEAAAFTVPGNNDPGIPPVQEVGSSDVRGAEVQPSLGSPGLSDEILSIQNRYIVGKAAGENLYAGDGRLIISKGQTITAPAVQMAEQEGKLPDLIVHMVIPGFGDEPS